MSTRVPQVTNASIQLTLTPGDVSPIRVPQDVVVPQTFQNASNLQKTDGQFTPANNSQVIHTFSPTDQANFILLIVDQPAVLSLGSTANPGMITNLCVQRFFYIGIQNLASLLTTLTLNGATSGPEVPMAQATPCNYTLVYGVAQLS
jgi:hypothetical protein